LIPIFLFKSGEYDGKKYEELPGRKQSKIKYFKKVVDRPNSIVVYSFTEKQRRFELRFRALFFIPKRKENKHGEEST